MHKAAGSINNEHVLNSKWDEKQNKYHNQTRQHFVTDVLGLLPDGCGAL